MKRSYSIPALCTAARKEFVYGIENNRLYLASKQGTFGLVTDDLSLLEDLQNRPAVTLEMLSPARALQAILDTKGSEVARDTGITIPKDRGFCRVIRIDGRNDDHIALVNEMILAPFKPLSAAGTNIRSPILLVCPDCFAVVMPVRYGSQKLANQLLVLDETLNG